MCLNPGSYRIPVKLQYLIPSKAFAAAVSKVLMIARSRLKTKVYNYIILMLE